MCVFADLDFKGYAVLKQGKGVNTISTFSLLVLINRGW